MAKTNKRQPSTEYFSGLYFVTFQIGSPKYIMTLHDILFVYIRYLVANYRMFTNSVFMISTYPQNVLLRLSKHRINNLLLLLLSFSLHIKHYRTFDDATELRRRAHL